MPIVKVSNPTPLLPPVIKIGKKMLRLVLKKEKMLILSIVKNLIRKCWLLINGRLLRNKVLLIG